MRTPDISSAYSGLSMVLFMLNIGMYADDPVKVREEAVSAGRKAVELDRDDVNAYVALGRSMQFAAMHTGDFEEAIATLRHALEINPASPMAHYSLLRAYDFAGQPTLAISHGEAMLRLSPRDQYLGQTFAGISKAYFQLKDYEKSLEYMTMAMRAQAHLVWPIRVTRIAALALIGRIDEAQNETEIILERYPDASISRLLSEQPYVADIDRISATLRSVGFPE